MPILFSIIRDITGAAVPSGRLAFRSVSPLPGSVGGDVRSAADITITASNAGFWSTALIPGEYYVWVGASSRRLIIVPDSPEYIPLGDLFTGTTTVGPGAGGENYRLSNAERQLVNADTGQFQSMFIDDVSGQKEAAFAAPGSGSGTANFRYRSGMLEIFCAETNTWHAPYLSDGDFFFAANGSTPQANDRINGGRWQIKDQVRATWRTWFVIGELGSETLAFGPEEA